MEEMNELDVVFASEKISEEIPVNSHGTIVYKYSPTAFEVEFFVNNTSVVATVKIEQISKEKS